MGTENVYPISEAAKKAAARAASKKAMADKPKPAKKEAKPKAEKPEIKRDAFGFREGTVKSKAAAMYASKDGATVDEIRDALNSVQLNLITELEKRGFTVKREKEKKPSGRIITRYFIEAK